MIPTTIATRFGHLVFVAIAIFIGSPSLAADTPSKPCRILVIDESSGWPVPLIELRTTNHVRFVTDNAGIIAMDDPSLMNQEVWFTVVGHGYGVPADGFGMRGIRLTMRPGGTQTVKVTRSAIAKRLGRLTGAGLFAESQKVGEMLDWKDGPVLGCDSIQNAVHDGKMFWAWGDTQIASYPLGIFDMTMATTSLRPFDSLRPPLTPTFHYFLDERGRPRGVAKMPGDGPTWLTGLVNLPDNNSQEQLVAFYRKIKPPLEVYEAGLCAWDDATEQFDYVKTVWRKSENATAPSLIVDGHPAFWNDQQGKRWLLFGNPLPRVRLPATFEAWQDLSKWEDLTPQNLIRSIDGETDVEPHSGSIAWNEYRQKWVTVFMQKFGKPSPFGTLWYAEADSPFGPWERAVEILSHENYTFYNPRLHPEFTSTDSPVLLFEATYTAEFADRPQKTPRYDYNQILYRLDLDDQALDDQALLGD